MSYPFNDEDETVVLMGCPTGGTPGCECEWCQVMGPPPAPRPRTPTGPQPSAAYLERIAAAGAGIRLMTTRCSRCDDGRLDRPMPWEGLPVCAPCDAEVAREVAEEQAP